MRQNGNHSGRRSPGGKGPSRRKELSEVAIPSGELDQLMQGVAEAFQLAARGDVRSGYGVISAGLFQSRKRRTPWASDIAQLWALSLAHFIQRYPASWFSSDM